jgi:hypothetical protein
MSNLKTEAVCCDDENNQFDDDSDCVLCRECGEWTTQVKCKECDEVVFSSSCCG